MRTSGSLTEITSAVLGEASPWRSGASLAALWAAAAQADRGRLLQVTLPPKH